MSDNNFENEKKQAQEIRDKLSPLEGREPLPESLSKDNIEKLLNNSKKTEPVIIKKTGVVRRIAALTAAAAVFVLCCVGVAGVFSGTNIPATDLTVPSEQISTAPPKNSDSPSSGSSDYSHILSFINSSMKKYAANYSSATDTAISEGTPAQPVAGTNDMNKIEEGNFSQTNLQVAGIDEADIIKTDENHIYAVACDSDYSTKQGLYIVDAAEMKVVSTLHFSDSSSEETYINNFYLRGDTLILIFSKYTSSENSYSSMKATCGYIVYDITDRANPKKIDSFEQDGGCVSSRITDGRLLLISSSSLYNTCMCELYYIDDSQTAEADDTIEYTAEQVIPKIYDGENATMIPADRIHIKDESDTSVFTVVTSTPLDDLSATPDGEAILGSSGEIYCSADRLYVMGYGYKADYPEASEADSDTLTSYSAYTKISVFDIASQTIGYIGSCTAKGEIINSYSADEYDGYFRIATCENSKSYITVFNPELEQVGITEAFGIDEQLRSVRFMGETAYAVTFYQTDPLFIIDLSVPSAPKITGEVKIPGFSEYLHPIGNNLLVGIGLGGTEDGVDGSAKISLFDVSNPVLPKEISSLIIEDASFNTDSLAFVTVSDGSFIVPLTLNSLVVTPDGASYNNDCGLLRFAVENGKLIEKNRYINPDYTNEWYSVRAAYIADTVYCVSADDFNISSFDMESGALKYALN